MFCMKKNIKPTEKQKSGKGGAFVIGMLIASPTLKLEIAPSTLSATELTAVPIPGSNFTVFTTIEFFKWLATGTTIAWIKL